MKKQFLLGFAAFSASAMVFSPKAADAFDLKTCPSTSPITSATQCSYVDPLSGQKNDFASTPDVVSNNRINVNNVNEAGEDDGIAEGFFGITDWSLEAKLEDDNISESGTFDLSSINSDFDKVMAVFKSGRNTTLVGYLLDGSDTFNWSNPWAALGIDGTNEQDISHISFYGSGTPTDDVPVPTPAAVLPILGGLFGAASRRKDEETK